MRAFREQKKTWRSFLRSWWTVFALSVLCVALTNVLWHATNRYRAAASENNRVQQQLKEVEYRKDVLQSTITALEAEGGIEREIRQKFNVVKQGEEVIIVVGQEDAPQATTSTESRSWWQQLLQVIGF